MKNIMMKIVCMMFVTILLFSLAACDSEPTKEAYNSSDGKVSSAATEETFGLNETAVFDTLKITATEKKESEGKDFFEPENGNVFVGVKFTIENISDENQSVSSLLLFDAYVDDVSSSLSFTGVCAFGSETLDGELAPGKKIVGWYVVETGEDWKNLELQVKSDWLSDKSATFTFEK